MKILAFSLAVLAAFSGPAFAIGNAFTYQGSLTDATVPATGIYDLQFTLQTSGGAPIGSPVIKDDVAVSAGVFSVELDFGPVIAGGDYQLQIGVRPGVSVGAFTSMSPATKITPAPQAIISAVAQTAMTVANGAIGSAQIDPSQVQARVASGCASGQSIRVVNADGTVTCEAAGTGAIGPQGPVGATGAAGPMGATGGIGPVGPAGVEGAVGATGATGSIGPVGPAGVAGAIGPIGPEGPSGSSDAWSRLGNSGTNPANNFIGTTDAQPLVLRTSNVQSLRLEPSSQLFNGTSITANVIAGSSANSVATGVRGATISGGGVPLGDSDPAFYGEGPNRVTNHYGTVGGGYHNQSGDDGTNVYSHSFATVSGGHSNLASGYASSISGGLENTASGQYSAATGGYHNCAGGDFSWVGGQFAKTRPGYETSDGNCAASSGTVGGDNGTFVWADDQFFDFISTGARQFLVRAQGGAAINSNDPAGNTLRVNGKVRVDTLGVDGTVALCRNSSNQLAGCDYTPGTVSSVATGTGLTGGPITSAGTIAIANGGVGLAQINTAQVQSRVATSCSNGYSIRAIFPDGSVSCEFDDTGIPGWNLGGNAGTNPAVNYIGTSDNNPVVFRTAGTTVLRLEAAGSASFSGPLSVTGLLGLSGDANVSGTGKINFSFPFRQNLNLLNADYGIGTQTSRLYFRTGAGAGFSWFGGGVHSSTTDDAGGGTLRMRLSSTGQLQTTTGTISTLSDARLKDQVQDYSHALDQINALRPVRYHYRDAGKAAFQPEGMHLGFIAQEVQQVFPEWVSQGDDGYLMLSMRGFEAVAVRAMQELNAKNDQLSEKNAALTAKLASQDARLNALEARLK